MMITVSEEFFHVSKKYLKKTQSQQNGRNSHSKRAFRKKEEAEWCLMKFEMIGYPDGEPEASKKEMTRIILQLKKRYNF